MKTFAKEFADYVTKSIAKGGGSTRSTTDLKTAVDYKVRGYLKTLTPNSPKKRVNSISSYVYNRVLEHIKNEDRNKKKAEKTSPGIPPQGLITVIDKATKTGRIDGFGKVTYHINRYQIQNGLTYNYRLVKKQIEVLAPYTGAIPWLTNWGTGGYDTILRNGGNVVQGRLTVINEDTDDPPDGIPDVTTARIKGATVSIIEEEALAFREPGLYGYVFGNNYIESRAADGTAVYQVDISAYLQTANASLDTFTVNGASHTQSRGSTDVVKILFYGKYRILCLYTFYKTVNDAYPGSPWESTVCEMLIIDSETEQITGTKTVTHSNWSSIKFPDGFVGGFVDIQINKQDGSLLLLEGTTPTSSSSWQVKYYNSDGGNVPVLDHQTTVTVYRQPYTLKNVKLNDSASDFTELSTKYSNDGTVTSIYRAGYTDVTLDGGGVTSMMFFQQPETFKLFIGMHYMAYKQNADNPNTSSTREMDEAFDVMAMGRWHFHDVTTGKGIYTVHSLACNRMKVVDTVSDFSEIVTTNYSGIHLWDFIEKYTPEQEPSQYFGTTFFYEHLGGSYLGRFSSVTSFTTDLDGVFPISLSYDPSTDCVWIPNDRFMVLEDSTVDTPIGGTAIPADPNPTLPQDQKVIWHNYKLEAFPSSLGTDSEAVQFAYYNGPTFFKNENESRGMEILGATGIDKSERRRGNFADNYLGNPDTLTVTWGENNCNFIALDKSTYMAIVSRVERINYISIATGQQAKDGGVPIPSETNYDCYTIWAAVRDGGMFGTAIQGAAVTQQDCVNIFTLEVFANLQSLVSDYLNA